MKKLLADLFKKKEKSRHAAAAKKPVRLPRLRDIHFRSIRARGMFVGSGLVLLAIVISLAAYTLSLQAYYYLRHARLAAGKGGDRFGVPFVLCGPHLRGVLSARLQLCRGF